MSPKSFDFNDGECRGRFLEHVALTGKSVSGACRHFGTTTTAYHRYCRKNPEFRIEYEEARAESADQVLDVMRRQGEMGDVPSASLYLKHTSRPPDQKVQVEQHHKHELSVSPETIKNIKQLERVLDQRALEAAPDYIEGEVVDD